MIARRSALLLGLLLSACSGSKASSSPGQADERRTLDEAVPAVAGEMVRTYDLNRDGKPDLWKYYVPGKSNEAAPADAKAPSEAPAGATATPATEDRTAEPAKAEVQARLVRKDIDVNFDGRVDIHYFYAEDGALEREALDLDFDGRVDEVNFYERGEKVRTEMDLDFDGKPDLWKYFEKGKLTRKERDTNGDGKPDYWEYWEGDHVDRIGQDTDGDGTVDRWVKKQG